MGFCSLLLFHLSYYIISHLIQQLAVSVSSKKANDSNRYSDTSKMLVYRCILSRLSYYLCVWNSEIENLKRSRYIFGCLCKATIELNRVYSFLTLVTVGSKLITTVYCLFSVIYQLQKPNLLMSKAYSLNTVSVFLDVFLILTFLTAADMPINKVSFSIPNILNQFIVHWRHAHNFKICTGSHSSRASN